MNMNPSKAQPAYHIRILDPDMQRYLQQYPFASGPDVAKNRAARVAIKAGLQHGICGTPPQEVMLQPEDTRLPQAHEQSLRKMFTDLGFSHAKQTRDLEDFGWEANLVPRTSRRVLVIGCGDGTELLFLRAFLPEAKILALDYRDNVAAQQKKMIGMEFIAGDMHLHLSSLAPVYDLIFSNHTLEHLYAPEKTIATLYRLLVSGGTLVSVLPMDGNPGSPFLRRVQRLMAAKQVHPIDYPFLDAGHPWKTNPCNVNATLHSAGFSQVVLYRRAAHLTRQAGSRWGTLPIRQALAVAAYRVLFGTTRSFLKLLFPATVPEKLVKGLFAIERRTPFGATRVRNRYTHEALIYAVKSSSTPSKRGVSRSVS
jgi:SAM-dependent methyltransferase